MFVDRVSVNLKAGNGGAGVSSFLRTKGRPKGRPDGGNGGRGGDVIVRADASVATLLRYKRQPHHRAGDGTHGQGDLRSGRHGSDLVVPVPLGTVVIDEEGTVVADLVKDGHEVLLLKGGRGGKGNAAFVSPKLRAPAIAEQGEYGKEAWFTFELKLLADAALIGYPNAGKSTIISTVSAAKSKVADYPFTTLEPHLGVVAVDDREFVMADIPGLIEGAADGRGLGHEFLRHVERARVMVIVLDPSPLQTDPVDRQLAVLSTEMERYLPELAERPRLVILSKGDLPEAKGASEAVPEAIKISAVSGEGIDRFLHATADLVDLAHKAAPDRPGFVLHRPAISDLKVAREGRGWRVEGTAARRAVAFADLTDPDAARIAADRLARIGVDEALAAAGAMPGDEVRIGDLVMEYSLAEDSEE
ncbi:MAG TPA: GTPase ObgE [Acidimicrobiia bacterium]|nr:GTPase ObgE [Acidimicrobiia bacterium]